MALTKSPVNINFAQGLDQKSDPKQIPIGKFRKLYNSIFQKNGLLQKRNGFGALPSLPNVTASYLTTFNENLTAIGNNIYAYSQNDQTWITKGSFQPLSLDVLPLVRSALSQTQCDSVIAPNGSVCIVYTEVNAGVSTYSYLIQDGETGQNIIAPTLIPAGSGVVTGSPRVFLLGSYFIIAFTNVISGVSHLQYIAVSSVNPLIVSAAADIASSYISNPRLSWDGVVVGTKLFFAYNTTAGGQQIQVTYLSSSFIVATPTSFVGAIATIMSMCADITNTGQPIIYAAFYDVATPLGQVVAVDQNLNTVLAATTFTTNSDTRNVTCTAQNGICQIAYEINATYSYDSTIETHFLRSKTVTQGGTVGSPIDFLRSVGLASKGFLYNGLMYMLVEYSSSLQPTYFLIDINGHALARFAYENGGGYLSTGLPQAQVIGIEVTIPYLYKDLIQAVNKDQGLVNFAGIYSQTGVNQIAIDFTADTLSTSEIGTNLNISSGFLYAYDGNTLNEQGFHVFPDSVEAALIADPTPTGTISNVTNPTVMTAVSSVANIVVGMNISGTGIPAGTKVVAVGTTTITMSAAATSATTGTYTFTGSVSAQQYFYQAIYQWTDAQGNIFNSSPSIPISITATAGHTSIRVNVPTYRITYKPNVKIIIYRWSTAQQNYYQVTSISSPLLNVTTVDSVSFEDVNSDAQILGNSLIYTTGGVVENIAGPACTATTLFDTRLWLIDAEDKNLLWYSKQLVEGTPVEMSDLFTFYVAPNAGATASTGPMHCLAPMDDKLVIFKRDAIYYINGSGPDNTGSNSQYSQAIFITSTVGSINQKSIVLIPQGLLFESNKGKWLLGRDLSTSYLGSPVEDSNDTPVTSAVTVPGTTEVRLTLNDQTCLSYDYYFQQWSTFNNINAVSSTIYNGLHTYLSSFGTVSQETPGVYLDNGNPVLISFKTGPINIGGLRGYERLYEIFLLGEYLSPHTLQIGLSYNYNSGIAQSIVVNPVNFVPKYGEDPLYGNSQFYGGFSSIEQWRLFPALQKCQAIELTLNEVFDPSFGVPAGAGLTLSGLSFIMGFKKGYAPVRAATSAG